MFVLELKSKLHERKMKAVYVKRQFFVGANVQNVKKNMSNAQIHVCLLKYVYRMNAAVRWEKEVAWRSERDSWCEGSEELQGTEHRKGKSQMKLCVLMRLCMFKWV